MADKLRAFLTTEQLNRVTFKGNKVYLDLHGLGKWDACRLIKNIGALCESEELVLIHGYNHGTVIKEMIYGEKLFGRNHTKHGKNYNPGVTTITFA